MPNPVEMPEAQRIALDYIMRHLVFEMLGKGALLIAYIKTGNAEDTDEVEFGEVLREIKVALKFCEESSEGMHGHG